MDGSTLTMPLFAHKCGSPHNLMCTLKDLYSEVLVHRTILQREVVMLQELLETLRPLFLHGNSFPQSAVQLFTVL